MMKPTRPHIAKGGPYPPEFREDAVRYYLSIGQTLKAVAADLGVTPDCLRTWRRQMEAVTETPGATAIPLPASNAPSSASELALAREVGQLRRELEAMTRQRDILKKAISIFSEDQTMNGGSK